MNGFGNSNFFTAVIFTFTDVFILARDNTSVNEKANSLVTKTPKAANDDCLTLEDLKQELQKKKESQKTHSQGEHV